METQEGDRKNAILRGFEKRILFQRPQGKIGPAPLTALTCAMFFQSLPEIARGCMGKKGGQCEE